MKSMYEVILLAAGLGERMGASHNKVLLPLGEVPVFAHALQVFFQDPWCKKVVLVIRAEDEAYMRESLSELTIESQVPLDIAYGGDHRQKSVYAGLEKIQQSETTLVMVHDAARPFIQQKVIDELNEKATQTGAALLAVPAKDTIKVVRNGVVQSTLYRPEIWQVQTPQAFNKEVLVDAHQQATKEQFLANEEGELVERLGKEVAVVKGSYDNIKITTPEDFIFAQGLLTQKKGQ